MSEPGPCWVDGEIVDRDAPALSVTDSASTSGRGCYTTARFRGGRVRFGALHADRLVRDARRLGIGDVDPGRVLEGLEAAGRAAFGSADDSDGIVRIQASRGGDGRTHLSAVPRAAGREPTCWRACLAPFPHEGRMPWSGAKVSNHLLFALAGDHARAQGVDEAFLLDAGGYAIEGSRSNLIVVGDDGVPATPDPSRGGVVGVGLQVLRAGAAEIRNRDVAKQELLSARELIAVNSIRGPHPVVELAGEPVADGRPGPLAARLQALFDEA